MNYSTFSKKNRKKAATVFFSLVFIFNFYQSHAQFTPGDLVVYRVDNGSSSLNTAAAVNVYLDEYATTGTGQSPVLSVALPATAVTAGFTESGKATSDGLMRLSTNDQYLVFPGYLAKLGTANIVISSSIVYPRIIGRINPGGAVNTTTEITDGYDNNNIRSACSDDGDEFWTAGNDASSGTRYVSALGNTTSIGISTTEASTNSIFIINGQLYTSVNGTGIYTVGSGLPTSAGQTMTLLSATNSGTGEDFLLLDVNGSSYPQLLYIADQTNGIYKYTSADGTTWTKVGAYYTVTGGADGITGYVDCNGNAQLFFTDNPGLGGNNLWSVTDNNAYASGTVISGTAVKLATASSTSPHQSGFRGVAFAPVASYPTVSINPTAPTICDGGSGASLTASEVVGATGVDGVTYTWSPSIGLSATTGAEVTAIPTVTSTYTVEAASPYANASSSPVTGEGCISATVVVTVNEPPTADAGNNNDTAICPGSAYTVTNASATNSSSSLWTSSSGCNTCFSSATVLNPVYTPSSTDITNGTVTISLIAVGNSPCGNDTGTKIITIDTGVHPVTILPQSPTVCKGESISLYLAAAGKNFIWAPLAGLNDTTGDTVVATPIISTRYMVSGTDSFGCKSIGTDSVTVGVALPLTIQSQPTPPICVGQDITLSVPASGRNYKWTPVSSVSPDTGYTVVATPLAQTTYTVTGIDSLGCTVLASDIVSIKIGINKPTITDTDNVLTSSATQSNQWYRNSSQVNGATNETYTATDTGCYWSIATNLVNGCSSISDTICLTSLAGINRLSINSNQLSIYPNPTNGEIAVNISSSVSEVKDWYLLITDVLGRTVYIRQSLTYSNDIDLFNLPGGVYFITVINKTGRAVVPVVKQ